MEKMEIVPIPYATSTMVNIYMSSSIGSDHLVTTPFIHRFFSMTSTGIACALGMRTQYRFRTRRTATVPSDPAIAHEMAIPVGEPKPRSSAFFFKLAKEGRLFMVQDSSTSER
jgi:hypothetical protein